jgi:hypothetical protein
MPGLAGVFAVGGLCNFGRVYLMRVSGQNITAALRNKVSCHFPMFKDREVSAALRNKVSCHLPLLMFKAEKFLRHCEIK